MIIYGHRSTSIGSTKIPYEVCPNCNHEGAMSLHIFSNYAHIFWIPLFAFRKYVVAHCANCDAAFDKKQQSESIKREASLAKGMYKSPIWTFSGVGVLGVIIIAGTILSNKSNEEEKKFIADPKVGDEYTLKVENDYTLAKVFSVQDSIVGIAVNEFSINKITKVYKLKTEKAEHFTDTTYLTFSELLEMHTEGTLVVIDR